MKNNKVNLSAIGLALAVCACGSKGDDKSTNGPGNTMMNNTTNSTSMGSGGSSGSSNVPSKMDDGKNPSTSGGAGMDSKGSAGMGGMTAGNAGMGGSGTGGTGGKMMMADPNAPYPDPRGACDINSGFPDDHACILPPDPKEGMQIHIGPSDYNNPDEINKYVFKPGMESSECISFHTPNNEEIYYQTFELSGRAGTHHIINTMYNVEVDGEGTGYVACLDPGTGTNGNIVDNLPGASKAYMARTLVAPEYSDVGRKIGPNTPSQADEHYFNFTDADIIREFWMNIYFVPKDQVKREASQIRGMGGLSWSALPIQPGTDMVYQYSCPIDKDGSIIELLGHYHSHGKRFTAYVTHADASRDKVFEMYDYLDPKTYQYDTITTNPMFSDNAGGATSGILNVKAGDSLDWECHIINDSDVGLTYVNEVKTGEMCNLWGESLGPVLNCVVF